MNRDQVYRLASCDGKVAFDSPATARLVAQRRRRGRQTSMRRQDAYKCRVCGMWHIGSRPDKGARTWSK